jgi:hypothetical protein
MLNPYRLYCWENSTLKKVLKPGTSVQQTFDTIEQAEFCAEEYASKHNIAVLVIWYDPEHNYKSYIASLIWP